MNAVRSSTASRHVCFAVVFRFAIIRFDDNATAVLIRKLKISGGAKSESRFSSAPDGARMSETANREMRSDLRRSNQKSAKCEK